ncbi:MAG: T9SS type A sorting domain-containing protein [Bacteroidales bacterium]|nr:T9SS type A sorting domain-containing protein [Bacteroidales bacterium]
MKKISISILLIFILVGVSYSQSSYEFIIEGIQDQLPGSLLEDNSGNVYFPVMNNQYAEIYKIDYEGCFIDSIKIFNPNNGKCEFSTLLKISDSTFLAFGKYNREFAYNLWIASFDLNLNKIFDFKMPIDGDIHMPYIYAIVNNSENIVLASYCTDTGPLDTEIFVIEITREGEIIREKFFGPSGSGLELVFELVQLNPLEYRIIKLGNIEKGSGGYIDLDTNFNIISENQLPYNMASLSYGSIKFTESKIFYSGKKDFPSTVTTDWDLALISTDYNNILIDSAHFGRTDTVDFPGLHNNLDFTTDNLIYYGGLSNLNMGNPFYSSIPSWIMLNKLDTNLNIVWQKYYGGDAYYNLWSLLATQDGGCVMAGTKYDHQTQNEERDVYILKVNEDGLIAWVHDIPKVTEEILIYPNPGIDRFFIKTLKVNLTFELFDSYGRQKIRQKITNQNTTINTSMLNPGIYFYRFINENNKIIKTGKWIKN